MKDDLFVLGIHGLSFAVVVAPLGLTDAGWSTVPRNGPSATKMQRTVTIMRPMYGFRLLFCYQS